MVQYSDRPIMAQQEQDKSIARRMPQRSRSTFLAKTATDNTGILNRRSSGNTPTDEDQRTSGHSRTSNSETIASTPEPRRHTLTKRLLRTLDEGQDRPMIRSRSSSGRAKHAQNILEDTSLTAQKHNHTDRNRGSNGTGPKMGAMPRPVGGHDKLGTFSGVFVPTSLNVLSILMFLRFGFILGQTGVLGMMGMLIVSYVINLVTTLSLSAIATNGTVRGGGAYYLISRSLGPEFGGSIGVVFYLGFVFNTGMNAVGLIDCIKENFGDVSGSWARWLPEGFWYEYLWATVVLIICTAICLAGSGIFARCSNGLLAILLLATFSIPFSALVVNPFKNRSLGVNYTGLSTRSFLGNLVPHFTQGADGSQLRGRENFQDLFGILFPATGGIFAGASMSGDLKHPSKAIPKGTLSGLALTFVVYSVVILAMAATNTRNSFYRDANIIQDTNISGVLILLGEFSTTLFSSLMGVIGSAKLLQALARDDLLPGFKIFGQGTKNNDEPTYAIIITYVVAQLTMLCNINQIASFVTMTYLMTFLVTNLACFLLTISSAPNFRPSFHYFNWWTAGFGTLISGASMFFVDGVYATGCVGILIVIFLIIHYTTPPKSWGDVSQSLIYHQVRKYLLQLRQEHVKFWRPQILLFINDPRRQYKLIQFCNSLKKGALFVLGHVIVANDFGTAVPEARSQQAAWAKYIDFSKIKAFVNIAISPAIEWGTRNIVLSAGLGGMRPNIVIMGFYNLNELRGNQPLIDVPSPQTSRPHSRAEMGSREATGTMRRRKDSKAEKMRGILPTDNNRPEGAIDPTTYVTILEDLLLGLQINVALAKGFKDLEFPHPHEDNTKKYIDLWPIQMAAEVASEGGQEKQNVLTTNFDTYTLILQLGCILNTVPSWKKAYKVRVSVFVEYESDVEEERSRVKTLLYNLRIEAEVLVFWLASGEVKTYQVILNNRSDNTGGDPETVVDEALKEEEWWQEVRKLRGKKGESTGSEDLADLMSNASEWPSSSFRHNKQTPGVERFQKLKKLVQNSNRRHSSSSLSSLGVRLGMRTHNLHDDLAHGHKSYASASEDSESDESDTSVIERDNEELNWDNLNEAVPGLFAERQPSQNSHASRGTSPIPDVKNSRSPSESSLSRAESPERVQSAASSVRSLGYKDAKKSKDLRPSPIPTRPRPMRKPSAGKFSSHPVPQTKVASQDGPGPSIMFTNAESPSTNQPRLSIYDRNPSNGDAHQASGFPSAQSIPLSFNDLPCRAQHLILNELMQQQSRDTAVLFTTLPAPVEGTCRCEEESVSYLSDLEVLCHNLPPVLLVHSNSMTVTMNL